MAFSCKGAVSATGASPTTFALAFQPSRERFNFATWGTFVGSYRVERCIDGTNWLPCTNLGVPVTFTTPVSEVISEPDLTARYRVNVTLTSGTLNYGFGP